MKELCLHGLDAARRRGVTYADARFVSLRNQWLGTEDERVSGISDAESAGIGIRVLVDGAWGFAATSSLDREAVVRTAAEALRIAGANQALRRSGGVRWAAEPAHQLAFRTALAKDPFVVPLESKLDLLLRTNAAVRAVRGVRKCHSHMHFRRQCRVLASTDGTLAESDVVTSTARCTATAVDESGAKTRYLEAPAANAGYEHIERTPFLAEAERVGSEAVAHLAAKACPVGEKDLVLNPTHLALTMHESIGHATELDRVLGMEESPAACCRR